MRIQDVAYTGEKVYRGVPETRRCTMGMCSHSFRKRGVHVRACSYRLAQRPLTRIDDVCDQFHFTRRSGPTWIEALHGSFLVRTGHQW